MLFTENFQWNSPIVVICLLGVCVVICFIGIVLSFGPLPSKQQELKPKTTLRINQIEAETTLIVLSSIGKEIILQDIEDYQKWMSTKVPQHCFYFDNEGRDYNKPEKGKTYRVKIRDHGRERTKVLEQVSVLIMEDSTVG